ncbi:Ornithine lipid N-methyltransferase [Paenibacillus auburnensis]|uniref:Ornithine lipid N-methyltransferase n=2 Tax=Paenibacillus auburnensis TaxID=2905649 RepID=A0ABN8GMU1_9BACL|nr:Ornithine lipid N-methyltransferase [Paenibacillus auburnensis]
MSKKFLLFAEQFIIDPRYIGSILPSSNYLVNKVVEGIEFDQANYIVEFGPGTGAVTKRILELRNRNTILLLFERNTEFYQLLLDKFKHEDNLLIINDTAENLEWYMRIYSIQWVDFIISGLPSESIPLRESTHILYVSQKNLNSAGKFIAVLHSFGKKDLITQYFNKTKIVRVLRNFPPVYVLNCEI